MTAALGALAPATARATVDAPARVGDAVIVAASDGAPIDHGGSATEFSIRLPDGAACPGDSLHDQWRVQTFIVPVEVDPATLRYDLIAPAGGGVRYALYDLRENPYMQQLTQPNTAAGAPGAIPTVPPLSFAVYPPGTIPAGTYRVGLACTFFRETARYWDTTIVVVDDGNDQPANFVWRLESAPASAFDDDTGTRWWLLAAAVAAATAGWWLVRTRRRASTDRRSDSPQETAR